MIVVPRRDLFRRAAAVATVLFAAIGAVGTTDPSDRPDLWLLVDVSRSHGPDPAQLVLRAETAMRRSAPDARLGIVMFGADASLLRRPSDDDGGAATVAGVPRGFVDGTRPDRALSLVAPWIDGSRPTRVVVATDGRFAAEPFERAAAETSARGATVETRGPFAEPAEDMRLAPLGAAVPVADDRVRVEASLRGVARTPRRVRISVEAPAVGVIGEVAWTPFGEVALRAEVVVPDDATVVALRIADLGGPDARPENDVLLIPIARDARTALVIDDGAFEDPDRAALKDALVAFRVKRVPSFAEADLEDVATADVIVAIDQDASDPRAGRALSALREAVTSRGSGLVLLGGPRAFRAGGYAGGPLEDLSPLSSKPEGGREIRVLIDASGSMERDDRYRRAVDAARRLAEGASSQDLLRARPFAATPRTPRPAEPSPPAAFLAEAEMLRATPPSGGTRVALAIEAELATPFQEGKRRVLALVGDLDDPTLDGDGVLQGLAARLDAANVERVVMLLDPRPETERRAIALGGRLVRVADLAPRALLEATEAESFERGPIPTEGEGSAPAPWRNRARDGVDARVTVRSRDGAPLIAAARRGSGATAAAATAVDAATLDALIAATARPPGFGAARVERRGDRLVATVPPERAESFAGTRALRIGDSVVSIDERKPGVFEAPWNENFRSAPATFLDRSGQAVGTTIVAPDDDPEFAPPGSGFSDPGLAATASARGPTDRESSDRTTAPWLMAAAASWAAYLLIGRARRK